MENSSFSIEQLGMLAEIGTNERKRDVNQDGSVMNLQTCYQLSTQASTAKRIRKILLTPR